MISLHAEKLRNYGLKVIPFMRIAFTYTMRNNWKSIKRPWAGPLEMNTKSSKVKILSLMTTAISSSMPMKLEVSQHSTNLAVPRYLVCVIALSNGLHAWQLYRLGLGKSK